MTYSDPAKLKIARQFGISGIAFCTARVPETGRLYFGNSDFKVYEVDALAEKTQATAFEAEGHRSYVTGVALSGTTLVSGGYDGQLIWWETESKAVIRNVEKAHALWIRGLKASPDGSLIASVADDMVARVWDAATGKLIHTLKDHKEETPDGYPSMLYAVAFSPDGKYLATGDKVGHVVVWDVESGNKVGEVEAPIMYTWDPRQRRHSIGGIRSVAFSHDSRLLAAGGIGTIGNIDHLGGPSRIEVFEWQKGERKHEISDDKFNGLVEQIEFDPAGNWLLAAGGDHGGFVSFYSVATGKLIRQEKAPMHVHQLALNETHDTAYAVGHGQIAIFEFKSDRPAGPGAPPLPENAA